MYLDAMIRSRGYETKTYESLKCAYTLTATPLQTASYSVHLLTVAKEGDVPSFRALMQAGLSPNPCNHLGESLLHAIGRLGNADLLQVMLDAGCDVRVADGLGRTPLHDACWSDEACLDVVEKLLDRDPSLLYIADCTNTVPLSYVPAKHWALYIEFLRSKQDVYWPAGVDQRQPVLSELTQQEPSTRQLPDPANALTIPMAKMVASGRMSTMEAELLRYDCSESSADDDFVNGSGEGSILPTHDDEAEFSVSFFASEFDDILKSLAEDLFLILNPISCPYTVFVCMLTCKKRVVPCTHSIHEALEENVVHLV
jgi:Ankyrin repeats (3 copies)